MIKMYETKNDEFFRDFYHDGSEVILIKNKASGKMSVSAESFSRIMGYKDFDEMIRDDWFLDKINEYMKETREPFPINPIQKD